MNQKSPKLVYGILLLAWGLLLAWQIAEHRGFKRYAKNALVNRSHDITTTLELVIRSQRRFGGMVAQDRLESALKELVRSGEVSSLALVNVSGEVVASAGEPVPPLKMDAGGNHQQWGEKTLFVANLVDIGAAPEREGEPKSPTIVMPKHEGGPRPPWEERPRPRGENSNGNPSRPVAAEQNASAPVERAQPKNDESGAKPEEGDRQGRRRFPGPPRMDPKEFQSLIERRGLHGLIIGMSVQPYREAASKDSWTRWMICSLATVAAGGLALAWRNTERTSDLQLRLFRASEQNAHLKEMNLAAAGLAHETRNPLNIIRGLAQLVRDRKDITPEVERKCHEIIEETDRVTSQLNEFINYSRPRQVRMARVDIAAIALDVIRALNYDIEEKQLTFKNNIAPAFIQADEQILRQMIFNLTLNAIQAVEPGGEIEVNLRKENGHGWQFEISDNGPGVAPEHREEIFKPYFTTHQKGTGLGLSVVQQIVAAHGWEIKLLANQPRGAIFRISHLRPDQNG
jgi:signal transduction histidine kinase